MRGNGHTEIQETPFKHNKVLLYCEGGLNTEQVALKGCGVSIFGDIQRGPEGPALAILACGGRRLLDDLQRSLPTLTTL